MWFGQEPKPGEAIALIPHREGWVLMTGYLQREKADVSMTCFTLVAVDNPDWLVVPGLGSTHAEALAAIIRHIAQSNRIRRKLWPGVAIEAGSLGTLRQVYSDRWALKAAGRTIEFGDLPCMLPSVLVERLVVVPALRPDMTPEQALDAIEAEVCGG